MTMQNVNVNGAVLRSLVGGEVTPENTRFESLSDCASGLYEANTKGDRDF